MVNILGSLGLSTKGEIFQCIDKNYPWFPIQSKAAYKVYIFRLSKDKNIFQVLSINSQRILDR